jgi:hypothetical protein
MSNKTPSFATVIRVRDEEKTKSQARRFFALALCGEERVQLVAQGPWLDLEKMVDAAMHRGVSGLK